MKELPDGPGHHDKRWAFFRFVIAGLLLIASIAKAGMIAEILAGDGLLASRPFLLTVIAFEAFAGLYMMIGRPFWSWTLAVATFAVFSIASAYALATGQSCNCVSTFLGPQLMLPLDVTLLVLLMWFRPTSQLREQSPMISRVAGCLAFGCVIATFGATRERSIDRQDPLEFLLADELSGKPWPITSRFHPDLAPLETGHWLVIVARHDCEHCRELISKHFADPKTHRVNERTAILIAGQERWPFQLDRVSLSPRGQENIVWPGGEPFVASPAIFEVHNGTVLSAADGAEAFPFVEALFLSRPPKQTP